MILRHAGLVAVSALFLWGCAGKRAPAWSADQITLPPAEYQRNGTYLYRSETPENIAKLCREPKAAACATGPGGVIIGPNGCDPQFRGERFARLHCHEPGHVYGWPADHGAKAGTAAPAL